MRVDYNILRVVFNELGNNICVPPSCKKEINEFIQTGDFLVFSNSSLEALSGLYATISYEYSKKAKGRDLPNIFSNIKSDDEQLEIKRKNYLKSRKENPEVEKAIKEIKKEDPDIDEELLEDSKVTYEFLVKTYYKELRKILSGYIYMGGFADTFTPPLAIVRGNYETDYEMLGGMLPPWKITDDAEPIVYDNFFNFCRAYYCDAKRLFLTKKQIIQAFTTSRKKIKVDAIYRINIFVKAMRLEGENILRKKDK